MGPVYHISVIGVRVGGQPEPGPIGHLPVAKETLDASVIRLSPTSPAFPDVEEGIAEWRKAQGGVFNIPMAEIIGFADQAIRGAAGQDQNSPNKLE
jgi:hypothetical protein